MLNCNNGPEPVMGNRSLLFFAVRTSNRKWIELETEAAFNYFCRDDLAILWTHVSLMLSPKPKGMLEPFENWGPCPSSTRHQRSVGRPQVKGRFLQLAGGSYLFEIHSAHP